MARRPKIVRTAEAKPTRRMEVASRYPEEKSMSPNRTTMKSVHMTREAPMLLPAGLICPRKRAAKEPRIVKARPASPTDASGEMEKVIDPLNNCAKATRLGVAYVSP